MGRSYKENIRARIETRTLQSLLHNGLCILPRLSNRTANHFLRLAGIELGLRILAGHDDTDLGWKISRFLSGSGVDDWQVGMLQGDIVGCVMSIISSTISKVNLPVLKKSKTVIYRPPVADAGAPAPPLPFPFLPSPLPL